MQRILTGDCRTILPTLDAASFDACVCDPPYDLTDVGRRFPGTGGTLRPDGGIRSESRHGGFMGKEWDATGVAFDPATWEAVRRVLKPGGVLMAFGGTRTWHRLAVAVEDAGFVIFDTLMWLYGSGFPKHKTLLKPAFEPIILAKKLGAGGLHTEAGRLGYSPDDPRLDWIDKYAGRDYGKADNEIYAPMNSKTGGTTLGRWPANVALDEAAARLLDEQSGERQAGARDARRAGIGYMSPAQGTDDGERIEMGGGGASRFFFVSRGDQECTPSAARVAAGHSTQTNGRDGSAPSPARAEHGHEPSSSAPSTNGTPNGSRPIAMSDTPTIPSFAPVSLPGFEPASTSGSDRVSDAGTPSPIATTTTTPDRSTSGSFADPVTSPSTSPNGEAGALASGSRLFYTAKAGRAERDIGMAGMPLRRVKSYEGGPIVSANNPDGTPGGSAVKSNHHPTVKPLDLMQWLVRLACPPGGTILDPFLGSGSTLIAADREGMHGVGIETDPEYAEIARRRIVGDAPLFASVAD
jgi:DNA modification methylase